MNRYTIRNFKYGDTDCPMSKLQDLENKIEDGVVVKASDVAREIFDEIERLLWDNQSGEFRGDSIEWYDYFDIHLAEDIAELKKKYESEGGE